MHADLEEISATIYPNINFRGRVRNSGLEDYFRSPIESMRDKLAFVPVTFKDRSFSKPMRRDGDDRKIPRYPWPMSSLLYSLSSDRFQDRDTDNTDDRCRTTRTENRR